MFELITPILSSNYNGMDMVYRRIMSEMSYVIRSKGLSDLATTDIIDDHVAIVYPGIDDGQFLIDALNHMDMSSTDVLIYDDLSTPYNVHWYRSLMPSKVYASITDLDDWMDKRRTIEDRLKTMWDERWMKGLGGLVDNWPVEPHPVLEDVFIITDHCDRVQGNFYEFYCKRLRDVRDLRFRIPYNFSLIHYIISNIPNKTMMINSGFMLIKDCDTYEELLHIHNIVNQAHKVKYKTVDYWGVDDDEELVPTTTLNLFDIVINGYQCHLAKIPNMVTLDDARKMINYMVSSRKVK